jgi:hypothetical protein
MIGHADLSHGFYGTLMRGVCAGGVGLVAARADAQHAPDE